MSISVGDCCKFTNVEGPRSRWVAPLPGRGGLELGKSGDTALSNAACEHAGIRVSLFLTVDVT